MLSVLNASIAWRDAYTAGRVRPAARLCTHAATKLSCVGELQLELSGAIRLRAMLLAFLLQVRLSLALELTGREFVLLGVRLPRMANPAHAG